MQLKTISPNSAFEILQEEGTFQGYASVFHTLDNNGDIVMPGCFKEAVESFQKHEKSPKMLWQHDTEFPIGKWTHLREDSYGLYVSGKLFLDLPKAKEAYTLMKEGELKGLSIGYNVLKSSPRCGAKATMLEKVDLMEISLVTFPANHQAQILEYKKDEGLYQRILEGLQKLIKILMEE